MTSLSWLREGAGEAGLRRSSRWDGTAERGEEPGEGTLRVLSIFQGCQRARADGGWLCGPKEHGSWEFKEIMHSANSEYRSCPHFPDEAVGRL